ncbi:MAG: PPIC-type PPIASE domain-containing protein [Verrucomicrobia bacterium]|nr:MAG: PPIC-type PPIASE domain-containing protein [Verrucomicrobiota bacterium]
MTPEEPRDQPRPSGLNFSLPELPRSTKAMPPSSQMLLAAVAILTGLNLLLTLLPSRPATSDGSHAETGQLPTQDLKKLALKLEQQGLTQAATGAWMEYLAAAPLDAKETAGIWFRIGKLHQDAHAYEPALNAFYRAEALQPDDPALSADLGRRIEESLSAMGRFAALRHELADRVALDQDAAKSASAVVAEIGTEKITEADLDRKIEERIQGELLRLGNSLPEPERAKQKEAMLSRFAAKEARLQFLQQLVAEEVLYRKALQIELAEKPEVRRQLEENRRGFLASLVMQRRLEDYARVGPDEVKARYEANKELLRLPESLRVSRVSLPDAESAQKRISAGSAGSDWQELPEPLLKGQPVPGLKAATKLDALWSGRNGEIVPEVFPAEDGTFHVFLVRERTASRLPSFEEVADRLARETQHEKEQRTQAELLDQLRHEFDVVLHLDRFGKAEPETTQP